MNRKSFPSFTSRLPVKLPAGNRSIPRRVFVKRLAAVSLLGLLPKAFFAISGRPYRLKPELLSKEQLFILQRVQQLLFPDDGNGPGAKQLGADRYLLWVLSDPRKNPSDVKYIINGIGWTDETAVEEYGKNFRELSPHEQAQLVDFIAGEAWGESWLSIVLTFIFEALVSDPQYGANPQEAGWKWLHHLPGVPRPTEKLLYDTIFQTVNAR